MLSSLIPPPFRLAYPERYVRHRRAEKPRTSRRGQLQRERRRRDVEPGRLQRQCSVDVTGFQDLVVPVSLVVTAAPSVLSVFNGTTQWRHQPRLRAPACTMVPQPIRPNHQPVFEQRSDRIYADLGDHGSAAPATGSNSAPPAASRTTTDRQVRSPSPSCRLSYQRQRGTDPHRDSDHHYGPVPPTLLTLPSGQRAEPAVTSIFPQEIAHAGLRQRSR